MKIIFQNAEIAGFRRRGGSAGRMDVSFVFSVIDADILSCLFLLRFAELYPSNWHAPSLCYIVTHWCVHPPSLCISPLLCLPLAWFALVWFHLCVSLATPAHCPPRSLIAIIAIALSSTSLTLFVLPFFLHSLLHIHFLLFNSVLCLLLSPPPPPTTTCLFSTPVSQQLCRTYGEVNTGSCYRGTGWMMMVLLVLLGCVLWPGKEQMLFFFFSTKCSNSGCIGCFACVCVSVQDPRQVGRQQVLAAVPKLSISNSNEEG